MSKIQPQIQHSMFQDVVPSKLDIPVEFSIVYVSNYRVSEDDHGRNIASVQCLNRWPTDNGMARCKGKASIYNYQWMDSDLIARCPKCGCKWIYDHDVFQLAHDDRYTSSDVTKEYPLVNQLEK